ncbi:transmembrane protein, putative [Medicago truncatula]|uniref:Transmembrane protein, putative n=1 Tax=Medicago truncatula TaxID=3880 RepID=G7JFF1_MEDTR|nr:transmembrane protein, putative [Medicago truncatula]
MDPNNNYFNTQKFSNYPFNYENPNNYPNPNHLLVCCMLSFLYCILSYLVPRA